MKSSIEVRKLGIRDYDSWDKLVERSPQGTIFHKSSWLVTCSKTLNKDLAIYGCFKDGRLVAGCSLYNYNIYFLKILSSTIEMTPYGGIVLERPESSKVREQESSYKDVVESLNIVLGGGHFDIKRLTNSPNLFDIRPFTWNGWMDKVYYTYYLDLQKNIESSISKKVRNIVRKAIKNGIEVKKLNNPSIFYDLFSMTYNRQGLNLPVTKNFIKELMAVLNLENSGEMWIAETSSGEVVAAEIFVWDNKMAYRWAAASHTELRETGATSLLLYEISQNLKDRGFNEADLMAANTPQLANFISSFNPKLVPYYSLERMSYLAKISTRIYHMINQKRSV